MRDQATYSLNLLAEFWMELGMFNYLDTRNQAQIKVNFFQQSKKDGVGLWILPWILQKKILHELKCLFFTHCDKHE